MLKDQFLQGKAKCSSDIICFLRGGFGNQLFQYAAAFSVAKRTGGQVKLYTQQADFHHEPYCLHKVIRDYQETDQAIMYSKWQRHLGKLGLNKHFYIERSKAYNDQIMNLKPPVQLYGYFFSYRYFEDCEEALRKQWVWPIESNEIKQVLAHMKTVPISVGIHVRRGDLLDVATQKHCGVSPLTLDYYKRSVALLEACLGKSIHFYIFSNDLEYVKEHFDFCSEKTLLDPNSHASFEACYAMGQCDHMIVANSSLSWWGAWLNQNPERYVIAPRAWYNRQCIGRYSSEHLMDFLPQDWVCL